MRLYLYYSCRSRIIYVRTNSFTEDQHTGLRWAIVPTGLTESVGTIGLTITSPQERRADLGIVIGRAFWSKGLGTAAAQLVIGYAFSTLGVAEIHAEVLQRNLASQRLLAKVGFHLLRTLPGDPHAETDCEECCLFVLARQQRTSAEHP